jgi:hypothetical protein
MIIQEIADDASAGHNCQAQRQEPPVDVLPLVLSAAGPNDISDEQGSAY